MSGDWSTGSPLLELPLDENGWRLEVPLRAVDELAAGEVGEATAKLAKRLRSRLHLGLGTAVTTGLPFAKWDLEQSRRAIATLGGAVGPLMAQGRNGVTLYDVIDTGVKSRPGIRRSITREEQGFHTDGPWLTETPPLVALHCLSPADEGGESRIVSIQAVLERLRAQSQAAFERLGADLPWHCQNEQASHEAPASMHPLWWDSGAGRGARVYTDYVRTGALALGFELDPEAQDALARLDNLLKPGSPGWRHRLGAGESLWMNNRTCAHARSAFVDGALKRHYVRTWHKAELSD